MSQTAPEQQPQTGQQPQPPAKPDGITDEEWNGLGDPGKQAIVRERAARTEAERQLTLARARPTPPAGVTGVPAPGTHQVAPAAQKPTPGQQPAQEGAQQPGQQPDLAALIGQAVTAAVAPLQQRLDGYESRTAAERVHAAITTAAGERFHDPADAFRNLDLAGVVDAGGQPDPAKITAAIDKLLTDKPYLAKPVDGRRFAAPPTSGATPGATSGGAAPPMADQVKNVLQQMQGSSSVRLTPPSS